MALVVGDRNRRPRGLRGTDSYSAIERETVQIKDGVASWSLNVQYPSWGRYSSPRVTWVDPPSREGGLHRLAGLAGRAQADNPGGAAVLSVTRSSRT